MDFPVYVFFIPAFVLGFGCLFSRAGLGIAYGGYMVLKFTSILMLVNGVIGVSSGAVLCKQSWRFCWGILLHAAACVGYVSILVWLHHIW